MFDNGRKNIGVILCDIGNYYQKQVCRTLTSYALEKGYNLAFFSFFLCYGVNTKNGIAEANIINLIPYENFDGFIVCHDTFQNEEAVHDIFADIKSRTKAPVVTIRRKWEDFPGVLVENKGAIRNIVEHFIDVHHFDRIAFMSGPKDHPDAQVRLEDYKEALAGRGLPYKEEYVYYGDFWYGMSKEAAHYFVEECEERPQAIVCANDYMAVSLCNELINMGILIPDDIALSGFDDIWESIANIPPMTTVSIPTERMCKVAFKMIEQGMKGEELPQVQYLSPEIKIRNSCGCEGIDMSTMLKQSVGQKQDYEKMLEMFRFNTYMFVEMSAVTRAEELVYHTRLIGREDSYVKNFFICLGEGEGRRYPNYSSFAKGYPRRTKAVGSVLNCEYISTERFDTSELLPKEATVEDPMIYYFLPIHNQERTFGYFAVQYEGIHGCQKTFHSWLAILGNSLESLRLRLKTNALLDELNNLYVHDALTGLMNRRGFENYSREFYEKSQDEDRTMVIISIDMDNLKVVNDRFGHAQGDVALQAIGKAMKYAAGMQDVCTRIGGDEFAIVGLDYTEETVKELIDRFYESLRKFNVDSGLPYVVDASCGYYLIGQGQEITLESAMKYSDDRLYENKRERKKAKNDGVLRNENI